MKWQKPVENLINKLSPKHQIEKKHYDFIMQVFFTNLKNTLQRDDMPTVMIHKFGEFYPSKRELKKRLKTLKYNLDKERITEDEYKEKSEEIQKILDRLDNEKTTRNN